MVRHGSQNRRRMRLKRRPRALATTLLGLGLSAAAFDSAKAFDSPITEETGLNAAGFYRLLAFDEQLPAITANVSVLGRPHAEWDSLGLLEGAFIIRPSLRETVNFDDNIFDTPANEVTDVYIATAPQIRIASDWNQNAVRFAAGADLRRYLDRSDQNSDSWAVSGGGTLDVYHDLTVDADASVSRILVPRTSDGYALASLTPLLYDQTLARIVVAKQFNRLKISFEGRYRTLDYSNGVSFSDKPLDEKFLNRWGYLFGLRADYEVTSAIRPFVETSILRDSLASAFRNQLQTQTYVGANIELTHLLVAEAAAGYVTQSYGGPLNPPSTGRFGGRLRLTYFPTQLVTVTLTAQQAPHDSGLPTSPAYNSTYSSIEADYELLRNLIISARLEAQWNRYDQIDRYDRNLGVGLTTTYKISRAVWASIDYARSQRRSTGSETGRALIDDLLSFSIVLHK
jgi:hypothetical protein